MKNKIYILFATLSLFSFGAMAQPSYQWATKIGSATEDYGHSIAMDPSGNVYIAGEYTGTADFDPGAGVFNLTANGSNDIFFAKYTAAGTLVWAKSVGGANNDYASKIYVDASSNVYLAGSYTGTVDFDPNAGITNLTNAGSYDGFFAKYTSAGNIVWAKHIGGTSADYVLSIASDAAGNAYVTGNFAGGCDFDPGAGVQNLTATSVGAFVGKYDVSGNYLWAFMLDGSSTDYGFDIAVDGSGNCYVSGNFNSTIDFDPGAGTATIASVSTDIFLAKYTSAGAYVWADRMGGSSIDGSQHVVLTMDQASGNLYIAGDFNSSNADFDPSVSVANLVSAGAEDIFIAGYDNGGNYIFAGRIGGSSTDYAAGISYEPAQNALYVTGVFRNTCDFDLSAATANLTAPTSGIFLSKYDAFGNYQWAGGLVGNGIASDGGQGIVSDGSAVYATGAFTNTYDFDPGVGVQNIVSFSGGHDIFLGKYANCSGVPSQPGSITGSTAICQNTTNTYSISAVVGATSYTWILPGGWSGTSTTNTISTTANSTSGNISVAANNACGSSAAQTLAVTVSSPVLSLTPTSATCFGSCNGSITPTPNGGIAPYTYSPSALTNLCANTYTVTVTDNAGCIATQTATITQPTALTATATATTPSFCIGGCTDLNINASGGTPGYTYNWMPGNMTNATPNVCPTITTTYTCTVTDVGGCAQAATTTVTVNQLPIVTYNETQTLTCINWNPITLTAASPAGGTYSGPGVTGNQFDPAAAGAGTWNIVYTYTDANTCTNSTTQQITVDLCLGVSNGVVNSDVEVFPNPFSNSITITNNNLQTKSEIKIYDMLGEEVYSSSLTNQKTEIDLGNLQNGIYFIRITSGERMITKKIVKQQ